YRHKTRDSIILDVFHKHCGEFPFDRLGDSDGTLSCHFSILAEIFEHRHLDSVSVVESKAKSCLLLLLAERKRPALPSFRLFDDKDVDFVTFLDVAELIEAQSAFETSGDFSDVILEALESIDLTIMNDLAVTVHSGDGTSGDFSIE